MRHQLRPSLAVLFLALLLTGPPLFGQQPPPQPPVPPPPAAPAPAPAPPAAQPAQPIERSAPAFPYAVAVAILVLFMVIVCMPSRKA